MKNRLLVVVTLLVTLFNLFLPAMPVFAAESDPNRDVEKRKIEAAMECLDRTDVINTSNKVVGADVSAIYKGLFRTGSGDAGTVEKIPVGFDIDPVNGVINCVDAIRDGLLLTELKLYNVKATTPELAEEIVIRHFIPSLRDGDAIVPREEYYAINKGNDNSEALGEVFKIQYDSRDYEEPIDDQLIKRLLVAPGDEHSFINICFSFTPVEAGNVSINDSDGDFKVDDLGAFTQIKDIDWKQFSWIKDNSSITSLTKAEIGGIDLGFPETLTRYGGFNSKKSDFFPFGRSSWSALNGYTEKAIVDCGFIKKNKDFIFQNTDNWSPADQSKIAYSSDSTSINDSLGNLIAAYNQTSGTPSSTQNCRGAEDASLGGGSGLILCPVISWLLEGIQWAERNIVIPYLTVNNLETIDPATGQDSSLFSFWKVFRNISLVGVILAIFYLLFMQAASSSDAYKIKRLAPRLVIAFIGIQLSYYLAGLAIDIFNILGYGITGFVGQIIATSPDAVLVGGSSDVGGTDAAILAVGGGSILAGVASGAIIAGPIIVFAITAAIAMLGVVITLVLRQMLIAALVLVSPFAIMFWLLPNTENLAKQWWKYFSRALVMYPLIVGLFAMGKLFAVIVAKDPSTVAGSGGGAQSIAVVIGFVANIAPLILVPQTFQVAGGVLAVGAKLGTSLGQRAGKGVLGSRRFKDAQARKDFSRDQKRLDRIDKQAFGDKKRLKYGGGKLANRLMTEKQRQRRGYFKDSQQGEVMEAKQKRAGLASNDRWLDRSSGFVSLSAKHASDKGINTAEYNKEVDKLMREGSISTEQGADLKSMGAALHSDRSQMRSWLTQAAQSGKLDQGISSVNDTAAVLKAAYGGDEVQAGSAFAAVGTAGSKSNGFFKKASLSQTGSGKGLAVIGGRQDGFGVVMDNEGIISVQQPQVTPGVVVTPERLEQNRRAALANFTSEMSSYDIGQAKASSADALATGFAEELRPYMEPAEAAARQDYIDGGGNVAEIEVGGVHYNEFRGEVMTRMQNTPQGRQALQSVSQRIAYAKGGTQTRILTELQNQGLGDIASSVTRGDVAADDLTIPPAPAP